LSLRPDEVSDVLSAAQRALESGRLNSWEQRFIGDMKTKIGRYGAKTRLSPKQETKLRQVLKPYMRTDNVVRFPTGAQRDRKPRQPSSASVRPRRNVFRRRRSFLPFRSRYLRSNRAGVGVLFALVILGALALNQRPSSPVSAFVEPNASTFETLRLSPRDFSVTDGDTIRLNTAAKGTRLVGFNTPETFNPVCERGYALGTQATQRLKELVASGNAIELELVACACRPGTQGTENCNYGRSCGILRVDGVDVATTLIAEGLAALFVCGGTSCPPTPRPWCE
jgi:endonuclease YncB( thermonuclease family)